MKLRHESQKITEQDERNAVEELRTLITERGGGGPKDPTETYWANLLVRSNRRVDDATSGKAISISWAARVAIPGVVAILSFFIGLHYYYVPDQSKPESSLTAVVLSIPDATLDSLESESLHGDDAATLGSLHKDFLQPTTAQLSDYFLATGKTSIVLEAMTEEEVGVLLTNLGSRKITL